MKAFVFDINRFAVHDGEGIRTTIFFKGCPLRCVWCQNPEGLEAQQQVIYMKTVCINCHECIKVCHHEGITLENETLYVHRHRQEDWQHIINVCPSQALRFDSQCYEIEEIVEEAKKDIAFYKYGGGVTISGGEAFVQFEALKELLKQLKKENIHVTLETSLYTSLDNVKAVMPYLDHIYADLKIFDKEKHKVYTGVDNTIIKKNIAWLLQSSYRDSVTIRTPLIPNMTATKENIADIATYIIQQYDKIHYELLNYNPLASAKYEMCGKTYCFEHNPKLYSADEMQAFYNVAYDYGIQNLIIET